MLRLVRLHPVNLFVLVIALFVSPLSRAELRVVGTDLLGIEFSKAVYGFAGRSRLTVALALDGSRPGMDELKAGRADLALVILPPGEEPSVTGLSSLIIGYHCIVVLVPAACPLERVTLEQLALVFGAEGPAGAFRWRELGLEGEWSESAVAPAVPEVGSGLTLEHFRHAVLRRAGFRPSVSRFRSAGDLAALFADDRRVLAISPSVPPPRSAKTLAVAMRPKTPAYLPTRVNVHSGDYELRMPLRLLFRRDAEKILGPLLCYLLSEEAALHLEQSGIVPLPTSARAEQVLALEKS